MLEVVSHRLKGLSEICVFIDHLGETLLRRRRSDVGSDQLVETRCLLGKRSLQFLVARVQLLQLFFGSGSRIFRTKRVF